MTTREKIYKLGKETSEPCVTISLNTHRTHPDSDADAILLRNLLKEAENRVIDQYGKRAAAALLDNISKVADEVDVRCNLDSLHIFLSDNTKEIIRVAWPTAEDKVHIADTFDVSALIKACNRTEEYLILLLSHGGVELYHAQNDGIIEEVRNDSFPFGETPFYARNGVERSNAKLIDDMTLEFFNRVDKAVVKVAQEAELKCVVISVEENYTALMQVADRPDIYLGHLSIDFNNTKPHQLAEQAWQLIKQLQSERRTAVIEEIKEAVGKGLVLTDLQEIRQAAEEGRGDLLIIYEESQQSYIVGNIVWDVLSKGGRVYFTEQEQIKELGEVVLKTRY